MTRPKVSGDKRQRVTQACNHCRGNKQKCDADQPCSHCVRKKRQCTYSAFSALKTDILGTHDLSSKRQRTTASPDLNDATGKLEGGQKNNTRHGQMLEFGLGSHQSPSFKEAETYEPSTTLENTAGKISFFGDSTTSSYLQSIRRIVKRVTGPSNFTDLDQPEIIEPTVAVPHETRSVDFYLDKRSARVLVKSFFTNTHGIMDILDPGAFNEWLDLFYSNPFDAKTSDLCLMYLVLAIGLAMATPKQDSPDHAIVSRLRSQPMDQADVFFKKAERLAKTVSEYENGDFQSTQALCLTSVYMVVVSKWQAAYISLGTAVRSAQAQGLHKALQTEAVLRNEQSTHRRNLWRSLFVLDRFLASSLGLPVAISDINYAESLEPLRNKNAKTNQSIRATGLDVGVQASKIINEVLKGVYSKSEISTVASQELFDAQKLWERNIHPSLELKTLSNKDIKPEQGMAILHVQLLGLYSTFLLTRPFFLHHFIKLHDDKPGKHVQTRRQESTDKLSADCVSTSTRTINVTQAAFKSQILPQRNPFVMPFLFAAALTILSNEFSKLHAIDTYDELISNAMSIMCYFSANDAQARRFLFILTSFRDVVQGRTSCGVSGGLVHGSLAALKDRPKILSSSENTEGNSPGSRGLDSESLFEAFPAPTARESMNSSTSNAAFLSQPAEASYRKYRGQAVIGSVGNEYGYSSENSRVSEHIGFVSHVSKAETEPRGIAEEYSVDAGGSVTDYNYPAPGILGVLQNQSLGLVPNCTIPTYLLDSGNSYGFTELESLVSGDPENVSWLPTREHGNDMI